MNARSATGIALLVLGSLLGGGRLALAQPREGEITPDEGTKGVRTIYGSFARQ